VVLLEFVRVPVDGDSPIVYQDGRHLGKATKLDMVANDRRPDIEF